MQKEEKAGAMWRPPVPNVNPIKPKKNKNPVWLEDANGASLHDSQSLNGKLVFHMYTQQSF